jgi:hypothetical protein
MILSYGLRRVMRSLGILMKQKKKRAELRLSSHPLFLLSSETA